jgi:hypothetical protein
VKRILYITILSIAGLLLSSCGEGHIDVTDAAYNPKIVLDAYIYGGQKVKDIRITRNFPLNKNIDISRIIISDASVQITDLSANKIYPLSYNSQNMMYEYSGDDLIIDYGKSYRIDVKAKIDGKELSCSSTTTVPKKGLSSPIRDIGEMGYRELDAYGKVKKVNINIVPSDNAAATILSITAMDASLNNYIYDNAYSSETDTQKIKDNWDDLRQSYAWQQGIAPGTPSFNIDIEWYSIFFYGKYRVVIYAADRNFERYFLTAKSVMEQDGNFHEPKMYIDGDGIGVFGSAVKDTVYFTIKR